MDTPICDFVRHYAESSTLRLHMPGHKGSSLLGMESMDITEIDGADSLYEASGIIAQSEDNASRLFGCHTFYSTEGSSLCIRAMLCLCVQFAKALGKRPLIAAGRNAHKAFLNAAALLNFDIQWLYGDGLSFLSCLISAKQIEDFLSHANELPIAVYLTSPDYLGNMVDLGTISQVCHRYGVLLLVDNAHGAYLKFLPQSAHPMDLGADMCCDSAHKTLPVLTGGAYLQISPAAPNFFTANAKRALALFGSTSPSYLIFQSLHAANRYISDGYTKHLADLIKMVDKIKERLLNKGYTFIGDEPLKFTVDCKKYGYIGWELAQELRNRNIECEFADPDFLVLMLTPETGVDGIQQLETALLSIPPKEQIHVAPPAITPGKPIMSVREATFSPSVIIPVSESEGRILSSPSVGCPPAVPIVVCGELINSAAIDCFRYYGIETCCVISQS